MALLIVTNPSTTQTVKIDVDSGDRDNRYAKFSVDKSSNLAIDEADMNPFIGEGAEAHSLPQALESGMLTITESALDSLVSLNIKNWVAKGLGIHYYTSGTTVTNKNIVRLISATGVLALPTGSGTEQCLGVARQDGTSGQYIRVMTKEGNLATVTAGEAIASGAKVAGNTSGQAVAVTTKGKWYIGTAQASAGSGADLSIKISIGQVS